MSRNPAGNRAKHRKPLYWEYQEHVTAPSAIDYTDEKRYKRLKRKKKTSFKNGEDQ